MYYSEDHPPRKYYHHESDDYHPSKSKVMRPIYPSEYDEHYPSPQYSQLYRQPPLPYTRESLPYTKEPISYTREPLPYTREPLPYTREPISYSRDVIYYPRDAIHYPRDGIPCQRDEMSNTRYDIPYTRGAIYYRRDPVRYAIDSVPYRRDDIHNDESYGKIKQGHELEPQIISLDKHVTARKEIYDPRELRYLRELGYQDGDNIRSQMMDCDVDMAAVEKHIQTSNTTKGNVPNVIFVVIVYAILLYCVYNTLLSNFPKSYNRASALYSALYYGAIFIYIYDGIYNDTSMLSGSDKAIYETLKTLSYVPFYVGTAMKICGSFMNSNNKYIEYIK